MDGKPHIPMEEMDMFRTFVSVCDSIWSLVVTWAPLARETVGKQLIRAADSVGANLVEGDGRYSASDSIHFLVIARASARETRYWIQRAESRSLLSSETANVLLDDIDRGTRQLNTVIQYRRKAKAEGLVKETSPEYET